MNARPTDGTEPKRILLVDDTPDNLRLLIKMLPKPMYIVHPATSGELALQFVHATLPDLILLDVMMPEMDGYEVCRRLKEDERTRDIPVIFLSAAGQVIDKAKAFARGGVDYITKPFEPAEVLMRIQAHLSLRNEQKRLEQRIEERTARLADLRAQLQQQKAERRQMQQRLASLEQLMVNMTLIESKLVPPQAPENLLGIPRLEERFGAACAHRVVSIVAPAGYGKTTTLAKLREYAESRKISACWLSLDNDDNNPIQFLQYIASTLQRAHPGSGLDLLTKTGPPSADVLLNALGNALQKMPGETALFLDDYHVIENEAVHRLMERLIMHSPARLRFFIASRAWLPLRLTKLRLAGAVYEFEAAELNLRLDEVAPFVFMLSGHTLTPPQIELMHRSTEGWPAGLQLASLALEGVEDVTSFLSDFSGRDKDISAYVSEIIFNQLPPRVAEFIGFTSLFERFSVELCQSIFSRHESIELLAQVKERNLFLIPLDREHQWYRYHHLFADYLRSRYLKRDPDEAKAIYHKASIWFEQHDLTREAIRYALAADNYVRAADLVAERAYSVVRSHGEHMLLLDWVGKLPPSYIEQRPNIRLAYAWALMCMRRYPEAQAQLESLERMINSGMYGNASSAHDAVDDLVRKTRMMRCVFYGLTGRAELATASCMEWLSKWGRSDASEVGTVQSIVGYAAYLSNDYKLARRSLASARRGFERFDSDYGFAWVETLSALTAFEEGAVSEAGDILAHAQKVTAGVLGHGSFGGRMLAIVQAQVFYELNRLDEAEQLLDSVSLSKAHGPAEILLAAYRTKARLLWLRGAPDKAGACLAEGITVADGARLRRLALALESERIHLYLRGGQTEQAIRSASALNTDGAGLTGSGSSVHEAADLGLRILDVRLQIATGQQDQAHHLSSMLLAESRRQGRNLRTIQLLCLRATLQVARGNRDEALRSLYEALEIGASRGACRVFADEDRRVAELLREIAQRRVSFRGSGPGEGASEYLRNLVNALDNKANQEQHNPTAAVSSHLEIGDLSDREIQILKLVIRGLANRDVAAQLFLSEATIKWHLRNIYAKLNVSNRSSAIARAHELSLV
jgi:ATP/maltotriose-dependent transcriptional regulator MalT/DNA-binding response OmpR family regulator